MSEAIIGIAGLAFACASMLELGIKTSAGLSKLARNYKSVEEDSNRIILWLERHYDALDVWMEFWQVTKDSTDKQFARCWGERRRTIFVFLQDISERIRKCSHLAKKYCEEVDMYEKSRNNSGWGKLKRRSAFVFSRKDELLGDLNEIRIQMDTLKGDSKTFFHNMHPHVLENAISPDLIKLSLEEMEIIETSLHVRKTAESLYKAFKISSQSNAFEIDLRLIPDYIKREHLHPSVSQEALDSTVKIPLVLSAEHKIKGIQQVSTVLEFVPEVESGSSNRLKKFKGIPNVVSSLSKGKHSKFPCVYKVLVDKTEKSIHLVFHTEIEGSVSEFSDDFQNNLSNRPLATLLKSIEHLSFQHGKRVFPTDQRLELACLLSRAVLNFYKSGFDKKMCSQHVMSSDSAYANNFQFSLNICGKDHCHQGRMHSPFEFFRKKSKLPKPIFALGLVLFEIGSGQLYNSNESKCIEWDPELQAENNLRQCRDLLGPAYEEIVARCLKGTDLDCTSSHNLLSSFYATVVKPLEAMRDNSRGSSRSPTLRSRSVSRLSMNSIRSTQPSPQPPHNRESNSSLHVPKRSNNLLEVPEFVPPNHLHSRHEAEKVTSRFSRPEEVKELEEARSYASAREPSRNYGFNLTYTNGDSTLIAKEQVLA